MVVGTFVVTGGPVRPLPPRGLFAGIDEIGILFALGWRGSNAEKAVLRAQKYLLAFGQVVGNERPPDDAQDRSGEPWCS